MKWITDGFRVKMIENIDKIYAKMDEINAKECDELKPNSKVHMKFKHTAKINGLKTDMSTNPQLEDGDVCVSILSKNVRKNSGHERSKPQSKDDFQYVKFEFSEDTDVEFKHTGKTYITNAFTQKMFDEVSDINVCFKQIGKDEFDVVKREAKSYVGHRKICEDVDIDYNRSILKLNPGDRVYCVTKLFEDNGNGKKVWNGDYRFIQVDIM